jgi:hypothetical protein
MKNLRRMCAVAMLSCIFAVSALAGDMHAGRTNGPDEVSMSLSGEISCGVTQTVITFLLSLL